MRAGHGRAASTRAATSPSQACMPALSSLPLAYQALLQPLLLVLALQLDVFVLQSRQLHIQLPAGRLHHGFGQVDHVPRQEGTHPALLLGVGSRGMCGQLLVGS